MKKRIYKIVLTGGPCGGKTSALELMKKALTNCGFKVFTVDEAASELVASGLDFEDLPLARFQDLVIKKMLQKEDFIKKIATLYDFDGRDVIILCDRGLMDNKAYMPYDDFIRVLYLNGYSELGARRRYDAVFHLVTAANGAEQYYKLEGARHETPEEACALDKRTQQAWICHDNFTVIDNSTSFSGKMDRLLNGIISLVRK